MRRSDGDPSPMEERPQAGSPLVADLEHADLSGILVYTDENCRVRALALPELEGRRPPVPRSCRFAHAGAGRFAFGPELPDPAEFRTATCRRDFVEVRWPDGTLAARARGCAPTWKRNGVLTGVRDGGVVEFDFEPGERTMDARPILSREAVAAALRARDPTVTQARVESIGWMSDTTLAAIVRAESVSGDVTFFALFANGHAVGPVWGPFRTLGRLRVSPRGTFVAARAEQDVVVLDRTGRLIPLPLGPREAKTVAWSPNERWLAAATWNGVALLRVSGARLARGQRVLRIPVRAVDLIWR